MGLSSIFKGKKSFVIRKGSPKSVKSSKLLRRYSWLEGETALSEKLEKNRRSAMKNSLIVAAAFVLIFVLSIFTADRSLLEELLVRPEEGSRTLSLDLRMGFDGEELSERIDIEIVPEGYSPKQIEDAADEAGNKLMSVYYRLPAMLSSDSRGSRLELPAEIDGVSLSWSLPESGPAYGLLFMAPLLALAVWLLRDDGVRKKLETERLSIESELPSVVMQLSLMMNAGLVLSSAFEEIVKLGESSDTPMQRLLRRVDAERKSANESFVSVLYRYALASGIKDFARFAGMMAEQQGRGSELAEKLERERQQLWNSKLINARGRSKTAETKLSFPLMLVLLSLVLISVGPALMEL